MNGKMKVNLNEVIEIFDKIVNLEISREEAAVWAQIRQLAEDNNELLYEPKEAEKIIWEAIIFLLGIDLKIDKVTYLESINNIENYKKKLIK